MHGLPQTVAGRLSSQVDCWISKPIDCSELAVNHAVCVHASRRLLMLAMHYGGLKASRINFNWTTNLCINTVHTNDGSVIWHWKWPTTEVVDRHYKDDLYWSYITTIGEVFCYWSCTLTLERWPAIVWSSSSTALREFCVGLWPASKWSWKSGP